MRIITDDSGSSEKPQFTWRSPSGSHVPIEVVTWRSSAGRPESWNTAVADSRNARSTTPHATKPTTRFESFGPRSPLIAAPRSGSIGISQILLSICSLPLQQPDLVDVRGLAQPEQRDRDREPDGRLGCRERHDEEDVYLRLGGAGLAREREERQVAGVQHQLDAHQDRDRAAPQEDADHAEREEHGGQQQDGARVHLSDSL